MALDCGAISSLSPLRVSLFITIVRFHHYGPRRSVYSIDDDDDDGSTEAVIQGMIEAAQRMIRVNNNSTEEEQEEEEEEEEVHLGVKIQN
ncbi:MAG: hypothetical protein M3382_00520 [Thermoproteota archaeon]|nr:hypothetical protein [Thermoproteota archaeon]